MLKYLPALLFCAFASAEVLSVPEAFPSIQAAIDAAAPGDTIKVAPGTYAENLVVEKTITIEGSGRGQTFVENDYLQGETIRIVNTTDVVISGFTLRQANVENLPKDRKVFPDVVYIDTGGVIVNGCDIGPSAGCGVAIQGESAVTVTNCEIHDNPQHGILWVNANGTAHFEKNSIRTNRDGGIEIRRGETTATIRGNEFTGGLFAIGLQGEGVRGVVEENVVRHSRLASIYVQQGAHAEVLRNTVEECSASGINFNSGSSGRVEANRISKTGEQGIVIRFWGADVDVVDNDIEAAHIGIHVRYAARARVRNNRIKNDELTGIAVEQWNTQAEVTGNVVEGSVRNGIWIGGGAEAKVSENTCRDNGNYGIVVSDEGTRAVQENNTAEGSGYEDIAEIEGHPYGLQDQVDKTHVSLMLRENAFAALEQMAEALRTYQSRWSTGSWQLPHFYDGITTGVSDLRVSNRKVYMAKLREWQAASPNAAEPLILQSLAHQWYAWQARGSGFADTVTEDGWRVFRKEMQVAADCLQQARILNPNDPQLYAEYITCCTGLSWDQDTMEEFLAAGRKIDPDYYPLLANAVHYLLPRWNGSAHSIQQLADRLAAEYEGVEADKMYGLIALAAMPFEGIDELRSFHLEWPRVNAGLAALQAEYPESNWFNNAQAFWACGYGERETAATLFESIGQDWGGYVWHNREQFRVWRLWAIADAPQPVGDGVSETDDEVSNVALPLEFTPDKVRIAALVFLVPLAGFILLLVIAVVILILLNRRKARRQN